MATTAVECPLVVAGQVAAQIEALQQSTETSNKVSLTVRADPRVGAISVNMAVYSAPASCQNLLSILAQQHFCLCQVSPKACAGRCWQQLRKPWEWGLASAATS